MKYSKIKHDATIPTNKNKKTIIIHCCNDIGRWGKGFVVPLGQRYPSSRNQYFAKKEYILGETQFVQTENPMVIVGNMIGQHKIWKSPSGEPPIRYEAIRSCLMAVKQFAIDFKEAEGYYPNIQFPLFGAGLAGGDWKIIKSIIEEIFSSIEEIELYECNF